MNIRLIISFILFAFIWISYSDGQENTGYLQEEIEIRKFDKDKWEKITEELDYDQEEPKPQEEKATPIKPERKSLFGKGSGLKIFFYCLFIAVFLILIYYTFANKYIFTNTKVVENQRVSIENIEENLKDADIDRFLTDSLNNSDFRLAIRLYYLKIIKELSALRWIRWRKEKTNLDYLYEMKSRPFFASFKNVTKIFDRVWYGEAEIDKGIYDQLAPVFENFLKGIRR